MDYLSKLIGWLKKHWVDVKSNWRNTDDPMALGLAWSKAFVAFVALLALLPNSTDDSWEFRLWTFMTSPPNEIGDTLAGIAGALAFLWIIVTVQLQSRELRAQREELTLAREEYAKMAEAQSAQVSVLERQKEIFEDEKRQRDEARAESELLEICEDIFISTDRMSGLLWFSDEARTREAPFGLGRKHHFGTNWDERLAGVCADYDIVDRMEWRCRDGELYPDMPRPIEATELREQIEEILGINARLPVNIRRRLSRINMAGFLERVRKLESNDVFWRQPSGGMS